MKENAPHCKIKAAGGIRTAKQALEMLEAGANRIGTSSRDCRDDLSGEIKSTKLLMCLRSGRNWGLVKAAVLRSIYVNTGSE